MNWTLVIYENRCLVCFKPMAPLRCWDTPYLDKLWYLKKRLDQSKRYFILKDISAREAQSLYKSYLKDAKQLSLLKDLFGTFACFLKSSWT